MAACLMNSNSNDAHLVEHTTDHTEVFKGQLLHAWRDTVRLPNGRSAVREYITHPGAVMIVPLIVHADG
ncbi:MAG: ADP-ribose pyrophosphatase, partial [Betaproteobacteria bacterium]|nr:ADP-ribose pyrophosphatase [Betaproteobacteria bacterium]